jgi:dUTP pyrophosphatase
MKLKFKKLDPKAVTPSYSKPGDVGLDLTATSINFDLNNNYIEYGTSLAVEIPENHVGLVFPRSSVTKYALMLKNAVAVIDSNFRGEIKLRFQDFQNTGHLGQIYAIGDRIGQLIVMPIPSIELD